MRFSVKKTVSHQDHSVQYIHILVIYSYIKYKIRIYVYAIHGMFVRWLSSGKGLRYRS